MVGEDPQSLCFAGAAARGRRTAWRAAVASSHSCSDSATSRKRAGCAVHFFTFLLSSVLLSPAAWFASRRFRCSVCWCCVVGEFLQGVSNQPVPVVVVHRENAFARCDRQTR